MKVLDYRNATVGRLVRFGWRGGQQTLGEIVGGLHYGGEYGKSSMVKVKTMEPRQRHQGELSDDSVPCTSPAGSVWTVPLCICSHAPDAGPSCDHCGDQGTKDGPCPTCGLGNYDGELLTFD